MNRGADLWAVISYFFIQEGKPVAFFCTCPEHLWCCVQHLVERSFAVVLVSSPASICVAMLRVLSLGHISRLVWPLLFFPFEFKNF